MANQANYEVQSSQVTADLTDFVVGIDLSLAPAGFWSAVQNGGGDIRVFKSGGVTELARDVVSCDTATDTGWVWVRFTGTLSSSVNTTIEIHADGTSADYAVDATHGRNNVWLDYQAVYEFDFQPSNTADELVDRTGGGNDGQGVAFAGSGELEAGPMGSSILFGGPSVNRYFNLTGEQMNAAQDLTIEAVVKYSSGVTTNDHYIAFIGSSGRQLYINDGDEWFIFNYGVRTPLAGYSADTWYWLQGLMRDNSATNRLVIDGVQVDSGGVAQTAVTATADIGGSAAVTGRPWAGNIAHIRFYYGDRGVDWAATSHANQNNPATFFSVSAPSGGVTGTGAASAGPASASGTGAHGVSGTAAPSAPAAEAQGTGAFGSDVTGTGAASAGPASVSASGAHGVAGTAAATAPAAQASGTGGIEEDVAGVGAATAAPASAQGWGLVAAPLDLSGIGDDEILEVGVPYSVNSIINGALDLIASNTISSLSDSSSHVGNSMKRNFDVERDSLLREYPWNFAMCRAKLASSSTPPAFRFQYAYELPAGPEPPYCLRVWAVGNEESRLDSDVWEISRRRLLTDLEAPLAVRYVGRIVNPALWDPLAVKALEARLAWQAAYLASGSAALAEQMARIYQERLEAAKSVDAQEGTPEPFEDGTTWIDSRLTGATW